MLLTSANQVLTDASADCMTKKILYATIAGVKRETRRIVGQGSFGIISILSICIRVSYCCPRLHKFDSLSPVRLWRTYYKHNLSVVIAN